MTSTTVPAHQLPTSCYVCGATAAHVDCVKGEACQSWAARIHEEEPSRRPACRHDWTNAEAFAAADEYDRRQVVATSPEARYVDQTRGR